MQVTIMSTSRLDDWVTTVVYCLVKKETSHGHHQIAYSDTYRRKIATAITQSIENVRYIVEASVSKKSRRRRKQAG